VHASGADMSEEPPIRALVDTGALYALLDADDRWHEPCVSVFPRFRLPLISSTAVLTELFHLVGDEPRAVRAAWKLVRSGMLVVSQITDSDMPDLEKLMNKYADRPMDFADATLVHLGSRDMVSTVFTVDHADFEIYRLPRNKKFRVLPASRQR
jgi:predicted nucleic acid-binding protein